MDNRTMLVIVVGGAGLLGLVAAAAGKSGLFSGGKNFSLSEFFVTDTGLDNETDDPKVLANIQALIDGVLQPIRDQWGKVTITSGYRSAEVNEAVGGASTSQHLTGSAADIVMAAGVDRMAVVEWMHASGLQFGQAIYYEDTNHLHVSTGTKREVLYKDASGYRTVYSG